MSKHEWETMNDKDFETMLTYSVSDSPPDDIVTEVTPWKKSMHQVLVGMALTTITFNFWRLDYLLPAIGTISQLLGFRALRHENKWFRNCFFISVIRAAYFFAFLILNTTIIQSSASVSQMVSELTIVSLAFLFLEFVCLWRGFLSVQQKANLPSHAGGAAALMVWYALLCLLAFIQYNGWIIAIAMAVGYIFIIRSLYHLSGELDEAGYAIHAASVKVTDRCIVISLIIFLLIGFVCGYMFGGSYPMEWTALDTAERADIGDLKDQLIRLGFPASILDDLSDEDIAACEGAVQVVVKVSDKFVNHDGTESIAYGSDSDGDYFIGQEMADDAKKLRITGIGVQIPGERERWIIFHHFLWTEDPGFYGTEAIQLRPVYRDISEGWHSAGDVTGRVLYDKDQATYVSDYHFLGLQTVTSNSFFWGDQSNTDIFAAFSMPRSSERQRGYIAYPVDKVQDGYSIRSYFYYTHQSSWLQYPAVTAMEKRMTNPWNDTGAFQTIEDELRLKG